MTPSDMRMTRRALDLTQTQMASVLHVHESTVRGWEAGTPIPGPAQVAVVYILRYGLLDGIAEDIPEWRSP